MLSKLFLPPSQGAERELIDMIILKREASRFSILKTRYFKLRTSCVNWKTPGYANLPEGLDMFPPYWFMPWKAKERLPESTMQKLTRLRNFIGLYRSFVQLTESILENGFNENLGSIKGDCLVHPEYGEVFIYTDGNQRMGAVSLLAERNEDPGFPVPVNMVSRTRREDIMENPAAIEGIRKGYFSKEDVFRWFDHPFKVLKLNK